MRGSHLACGEPLDRAVAEARGETVCGGRVEFWKRGVRCARCLEVLPEQQNPYPEVHLPIPPYSTSWAAAGGLAEYLQTEKGFDVSWGTTCYGGRDGWAATVTQGGEVRGYGTGARAPEALARAAFQVLPASVKEGS
jgi:hypothetical protein